MGKTNERSKKVQTPSCKISHRDVIYGIGIIVYNTVYLKVANSVALRSSHHKKKNCVYVLPRGF